MADIAYYYQKAAELILDDEAWRDALEDDEAARLLDWALGRCEAALRRAAGEGAGLDDLAYEIAGQARAVLSCVAMSWTGGGVSAALDATRPYLHPPLFTDPDEGERTLAETLSALGREEPLVESPAPDDADRTPNIGGSRDPVDDHTGRAGEETP